MTHDNTQSDVVERLRTYADETEGDDLIYKAADEIERLRAALASTKDSDAVLEERFDLLREAWTKRTGTVEVTGEAVPYLKIYFDNKENMAAFDTALRAAIRKGDNA